MKCPDCNEKFIKRIKNFQGGLDEIWKYGMVLHGFYYKCPKCKQKYEPEDVEE